MSGASAAVAPPSGSHSSAPVLGNPAVYERAGVHGDCLSAGPASRSGAFRADSFVQSASRDQPAGHLGGRSVVMPAAAAQVEFVPAAPVPPSAVPSRPTSPPSSSGRCRSRSRSPLPRRRARRDDQDVQPGPAPLSPRWRRGQGGGVATQPDKEEPIQESRVFAKAARVLPPHGGGEWWRSVQFQAEGPVVRHASLVDDPEAAETTRARLRREDRDCTAGLRGAAALVARAPEQVELTRTLLDSLRRARATNPALQCLHLAGGTLTIQSTAFSPGGGRRSSSFFVLL